MMRWSFCILIMVVTGCAPPEQATPVGQPKPSVSPVSAPLPTNMARLRFGMVPYLSAPTMLQSHQRLGEYLTAQLQVPVELSVADSYQDAIERLLRGEVDLMELSPMAYVEATRRQPLQCVVQTIADGSATSSGYLFVREDSSFKNLVDLKGARLGLVDPMSTSGSLLAKKALKDHGLDVERDFAQVSYLGNHEAVLLAVLNGQVDVGATYQGAFGALRRSKGVDPLMFRVIAKTPRSPRDIICARHDLPAGVVEAVRSALMNLSSRDRKGREILGPLDLNGFQLADDSAYAVVRQVAQAL